MGRCFIRLSHVSSFSTVFLRHRVIEEAPGNASHTVLCSQPTLVVHPMYTLVKYPIYTLVIRPASPPSRRGRKNKRRLEPGPFNTIFFCHNVIDEAPPFKYPTNLCTQTTAINHTNPCNTLHEFTWRKFHTQIRVAPTKK